MEDLIDELIEKLTAAKPLIPKLTTLETTKSGIEADIASGQATLKDLQLKLTDANAGLTKAQVVAQKEVAEAIYAKQQELKSIAARVEEGVKKLSDLNAQVSSKQALHDQLVASLESLKKKLA